MPTMHPYRDDEIEDDEDDDDVVDTSPPTGSPTSSASMAPLPPPSLPSASPTRALSTHLCIFFFGGIIGIFLMYSAITLPSSSATGINTIAGGGGMRGSYSDALSYSLFGGALSATPSSSNGPPTASQTPTPTTTQSFGGTASNTPSNSGTGSGTPSNSGTSTSTPTGSGTASGTGTPGATPSNTGTPSRSPSASNTGSATPTANSFTVDDCNRAARMWLIEKSKAGRLNGELKRTVPFTLDVIHEAVYRTCPYDVAQKTFWTNRYTIDDVCYAVRDLNDNEAERSTVTATWASQVPAKNLWIFSAQADPAHRTVQVTSLEGKTNQRRHIATLIAAAHVPDTSHCKWWVTATTHTWQNPRVHLASIQGISSTWPLQMGFFWDQMGFVEDITTAAGGNALWSSAGWEKMQISIESNQCPRDTHKSDDILAGMCALDAGVLPVVINNYDSSGAMLQNGVPLEPGPRGEIMQWLQQPHNRAGHWGSIEGMDTNFINSIYADYAKVYGPIGRLLPGSLIPDATAASPSAAPAGEPIGAPLVSNAAPCAVRATRELRHLLDLGRSGPTAAIPISVDVAQEIVAKECNPLIAPGANDPVALAGVPHAVDHNVCVAITYSGKPKIIKFLARGGYGWRMKHKPTDTHRRLWIFGGEAKPELYVQTLPGFDALDDSHKLLAIVEALSREPGTDHCLWWYFGGNDLDWVNSRTIANTVRGLHHEMPLAVALWWHGRGELDAPATGRVVLSKGALAAIGPKLLTSACPRGSTEDYYALSRCMWETGVIPVHSYAMDAAGMGIGQDWAFQQEP